MLAMWHAVGDTGMGSVLGTDKLQKAGLAKT